MGSAGCMRQCQGWHDHRLRMQRCAMPGHPARIPQRNAVKLYQ
jgi:hypothetical protein